jgi:hypothetical protein
MKAGQVAADLLVVMRRAIGVVALLLAGCLAAAGCVSARPVELSAPGGSAQSTYLYDARGRLITTLHGAEDRTDVPLGHVSRWLRLALVDVEDARFYQHDGVDLRAVARAALRDLRAGHVVEGGSTITQQYVKNAYGSGERSLRRKLRETGLALGVEQRNAKDEILAAYLNTVYFGQGAYGVEAAAWTYFSTHADRLTLPQAALLAGLVRSPSGYDPFVRPAAARARRAEVLRRMAALGHLQAAQAAAAAARPRPAPPGAVVRPLGGGAAARPRRPALRRARRHPPGPRGQRVPRRAARHHHGRPGAAGAGGGGGSAGPRRRRRTVRGAGGGRAGHRRRAGDGGRAGLLRRPALRARQPGHRGGRLRPPGRLGVQDLRAGRRDRARHPAGGGVQRAGQGHPGPARW